MTKYKHTKNKLESFYRWTKVLHNGNEYLVKHSMDCYIKSLLEDFSLTEHKANLIRKYSIKIQQ